MPLTLCATKTFREEWERRGLEVLEQMVDNMKAKYGTLKRLSIEQKIPPTGKTRISSLINDDDSSSSSDYDSHDNVRND